MTGLYVLKNSQDKTLKGRKSTYPPQNKTGDWKAGKEI